MLYRVYAGYSEYFIDLTSKLMLHSHFWARNETMTKTFINLQIKKKELFCTDFGPVQDQQE